MQHEFQDQIPDNVYGVLQQALPVALARGLLSYTEFSQKNAPETAKDFVAYHNACKAALGHLGALLKIRDACAKNAAPAPHPRENLEELLRQTRHVLMKAHHGL